MAEPCETRRPVAGAANRTRRAGLHRVRERQPVCELLCGPRRAGIGCVPGAGGWPRLMATLQSEAMRSAEGGADRTRVARAVLIALTIATLGAAVYVNSLTNPFVYDDFRLIVENRALATPGDLTTVVWHDITRPLVNLSYALDAAIWGIRPLGFHITNVLLHALNVALLFAVAWGLALDSRRPPLASAVIAAVAFA